MASNRLKLNPNKTAEVLWTGLIKRLIQLIPSDLLLNLHSKGSCNVTPTNSARLLGVSITLDLSLWQHTLLAGSRCVWQLSRIRSARRCTMNQSLHLYTPSSPIELDIVADYWVLNAAARVVH